MNEKSLSCVYRLVNNILFSTIRKNRVEFFFLFGSVLFCFWSFFSFLNCFTSTETLIIQLRSTFLSFFTLFSLYFSVIHKFVLIFIFHILLFSFFCVWTLIKGIFFFANWKKTIRLKIVFFYISIIVEYVEKCGVSLFTSCFWFWFQS